MATVGPYYSTQWTTAFITKPTAPVSAALFQGNSFAKRFDYTQAATGTDGDAVYLCQLPPMAVIIMAKSSFVFSAWSGSTVLGIGWLGYTTAAGAAVAASASGLLSALVISAAGVCYGHALILAASTVRQAYALDYRQFDSQDPVTITATISGAAPLAAATLTGWITYTVN